MSTQFRAIESKANPAINRAFVNDLTPRQRNEIADIAAWLEEREEKELEFLKNDLAGHRRGFNLIEFDYITY